MSNKLFLSLLCMSSSVFSMIQLDKKVFKAEPHLKNINLFHHDDQIFIKNGDRDPVMVNMLGSSLRKGTALKIKELKEGKSFLNVEDVNGQYKIELRSKLKGGALGGAWAGWLLGQGVVHLINQCICVGTASVVGIVCPPMFMPTLGMMEKVTLPYATVIGNKVGLGMGILGGVASGPV